MRNYIIVFVAIIINFITIQTDALASTTFSVGPGTINADQQLTPGHVNTLPVHTVTNNSGRMLEVKISLSDKKDKQRKLPPGEWFDISHTQILVPAGESRDVQVTVNLPEDASTGNYKIWFLFHGVPVGVKGIVNAVAIEPSLTFDVKGVESQTVDTSKTVSRVVYFEPSVDPEDQSAVLKSFEGFTVQRQIESLNAWEVTLPEGRVEELCKKPGVKQVVNNLQVEAQQETDTLRDAVIGLEENPPRGGLENAGVQDGKSGQTVESAEPSSPASAEGDVNTSNPDPTGNGDSGQSENKTSKQSAELVEPDTSGSQTDRDEQRQSTASEIGLSNDSKDRSSFLWEGVGIAVSVVGLGGWLLLRRRNE